MTTLFIFLFLILALILGLFRYKKLCFLASFFTLISFVVIGNGFFPSFLFYFLQTYEKPHTIEWKKSNTIVVLGAGTSKVQNTSIVIPSLISFSRIITAAELYKKCKSHSAICYILVSGGDPLHNGKTEAATYRDTLVSLGINRADIQLEPRSQNTFQNAEFTSAMLRQYPFEQIFLVSSNLTLKRALLYFSFFHIYPTPIPADFITVPFSKFPLGYNLAMSDFATHEIAGIARFYIYKFFGWNKSN
ncbi:MAG: YdcF family protein [Pseudomonadota bacterium]